ncbi:MAG: HEWD family protein [Halobacteriales archaeon]|nr:HEWD family protein [Halobacteriales archaeon]
MSEVDLVPPDRRTCVQCGREDVWNDGEWEIRRQDGERVSGDPFCLHEWDINGSYNPIIDA